MRQCVIMIAAMAAILLTTGASAETAPSSGAYRGEYFTGDGGEGKSISVERPKVQNVGDDVS